MEKRETKKAYLFASEQLTLLQTELGHMPFLSKVTEFRHVGDKEFNISVSQQGLNSFGHSQMTVAMSL